nr:MAG TPA: hypothetical protein [Caudoviricetes sp.]
MNDARAPDKELIKQEYLKGIKQKDICEKYDLSLNTLKSWIKRYGWSKEKKGALKIQKECTSKKNRKASKQDSCNNPNKLNEKKSKTNSQNPKARYNNKNAIGNIGGPGGPIGNKKAETHGFFSKYLPDDTLEIIEEIQEKNPLDILLEQITIQYAAIIRAQRIMYVKDKNEMIKEIKKRKDTEFGEEIEYEFQFAWDRQATFLNAQSRAMSELRNLIKQATVMINENPKLASEEQKLKIDKLKAEIGRLSNDDLDDELNIIVDYGD